MLGPKLGRKDHGKSWWGREQHGETGRGGGEGEAFGGVLDKGAIPCLTWWDSGQTLLKEEEVVEVLEGQKEGRRRSTSTTLGRHVGPRAISPGFGVGEGTKREEREQCHGGGEEGGGGGGGVSWWGMRRGRRTGMRGKKGGRRESEKGTSLRRWAAITLRDLEQGRLQRGGARHGQALP